MDDFNKASAEASVNEEINASEVPAEEQAVSEDMLAQAVQGGKRKKGKKKEKKSWKQELREWIVSIAVALLLVVVIRSFLFQIIRVDGDSMNTTLLHNERLFVTVLDVKLDGVDRGDIVICNYPNRGKTNFVKRIVAVGGDQVYRENGVTHVVYEANGEIVDEALDARYELYYPYGSTSDYEAYTLGEDEYFAVGDNRYNSHDSRNWNDSNFGDDVGPITGDMIVGKVRTVIWPLNAIRSVD